MATTYAQLLDAAMALQLQILADPLASGSIGGRTFTRHNISALQDVIDRLQTLATREAQVSSGGFSLGDFQERV